MSRQTGEEAEAKRRCCEQSFLASVAGLQKDNGREAGKVQRLLGLFLLAGVHLHLILWSALVSLFRPRYRRVVRFQVQYFLDVMNKELQTTTRG